MLRLFGRYARWLHCRWPAGVVEKLPQVDENGQSSVPGIYIVGDLTGIPLLKFSSNSGALAVRQLVADGQVLQSGQSGREDRGTDVLDVAIIGAGVSGMAAALEARRSGLSFEVFEASDGGHGLVTDVGVGEVQFGQSGDGSEPHDPAIGDIAGGE